MKRIALIISIIFSVLLVSCSKEQQFVDGITLTTSEITPISAEIKGQFTTSWERQINSIIGIEFSNEPESLLSNATRVEIVEVNTDNTFFIRLNNLTSETTYYYRVYISSNGNSYFGVTKTFTTPPKQVITLPHVWETIGKEKSLCLSGIYWGYSASSEKLKSFGFAFSSSDNFDDPMTASTLWLHGKDISKDGEFNITLNYYYSVFWLDGPYYCAFIQREDGTYLYGNTRVLEQ